MSKKISSNGLWKYPRLFKLDGSWSEFENKAANLYNTITQEIEDEIQSYEYNFKSYGEECAKIVIEVMWFIIM